MTSEVMLANSEQELREKLRETYGRSVMDPVNSPVSIISALPGRFQDWETADAVDNFVERAGPGEKPFYVSPRLF
jgi:hypothetical protein